MAHPAHPPAQVPTPVEAYHPWQRTPARLHTHTHPPSRWSEHWQRRANACAAPLQLPCRQLRSPIRCKAPCPTPASCRLSPCSLPCAAMPAVAADPPPHPPLQHCCTGSQYPLDPEHALVAKLPAPSAAPCPSPCRTLRSLVQSTSCQQKQPAAEPEPPAKGYTRSAEGVRALRFNQKAGAAAATGSPSTQSPLPCHQQATWRVTWQKGRSHHAQQTLSACS